MAYRGFLAYIVSRATAIIAANNEPNWRDHIAKGTPRSTPPSGCDRLRRDGGPTRHGRNHRGDQGAEREGPQWDRGSEGPRREHDAGATERERSEGRSGAVGMTPDYNKVKSVVAAILKDNRIESPPVPIKDMIENDRVDVKFITFATLGREIAGFTKFDEETIYINAEDPLSRQTWTMAHEFGHWKLHRALFDADPTRYNVLLRRPKGLNSDPLEKEANAFARMLLVPENLLRRVKGRASPYELSRMFLVSQEAMDQSLQYV